MNTLLSVRAGVLGFACIYVNVKQSTVPSCQCCQCSPEQNQGSQKGFLPRRMHRITEPLQLHGTLEKSMKSAS